MASVSLLVPAVVARDSLKQTAGISAGLGVEPFGVKKVSACSAPWELHKEQLEERENTAPEDYRGKNDWQKKTPFWLTYCFH